jgi:EmrB/QacA subfamily drug resistance transporter
MTLSPPTAEAEPDLVDARRLRIISTVLVLGAITTVLDTTIVTIALDHLRTTFGATVANTQWIATGYLLAYVSVIPVSGWLSERLGARTAWLWAVATFLIGSLLCGLAGNLPLLIGFRVLQGIGGGLVLPITISILTRAAGRERIGAAMITIALPAQLAPVLGPVIGGWLLDTLSWHWLFFVNGPICLAALILGPRYLPADPARRGHHFDALGFALLTPGVAALAYGVSAGSEGFSRLSAWLPMVAGAALVAAFTAHSLRSGIGALIDVRVFARRSFGLSSLITFAGGFSTYAVMFLLPLFYQQIRGESVLRTGVLLIPQGVGSILFLLLSRRVSNRLDGRLLVLGGTLLTMVAMIPFARAGASGDTALLLGALLLIGIGFGATSLPLMTLAFTSLSHAEAPRGSAAFSVVQRVGAPFGVAVIAVILQTALRNTAPLTAFQHTFWWVFGFSAIPSLLALLIPRSRKAGPRTPGGGAHSPVG